MLFARIIRLQIKNSYIAKKNNVNKSQRYQINPKTKVFILEFGDWI